MLHLLPDSAVHSSLPCPLSAATFPMLCSLLPAHVLSSVSVLAPLMLHRGLFDTEHSTIPNLIKSPLSSKTPPILPIPKASTWLRQLLIFPEKKGGRNSTIQALPFLRHLQYLFPQLHVSPNASGLEDDVTRERLPSLTHLHLQSCFLHCLLPACKGQAAAFEVAEGTWC